MTTKTMGRTAVYKCEDPFRKPVYIAWATYSKVESPQSNNLLWPLGVRRWRCDAAKIKFRMLK
jgi:hypothetical protein